MIIKVVVTNGELIMSYKIFTLKNFGDERGSLIPIEKGNNCPFDVKRAFYIYGTTEGTIRGVHANKFSEFLMIVISGSCKVLIDDGKERKIVELNHPNQALYLDKMVWKEMYDFSYNSVLLVLSNETYNENEYIRDYDVFKNNLTEKSS